jgi:hypothetical protein
MLLESNCGIRRNLTSQVKSALKKETTARGYRVVDSVVGMLDVQGRKVNEEWEEMRREGPEWRDGAGKK